MKYFKLPIVLLFSLLLTSCYGKIDPSELLVVLAVGVEQTNDGVLLTAQISALPNDGGDTKELNSLTIQSNGKTIYDAIRNMYRSSPKRITFAYTKLIVFDEQLAKNGLRSQLDYFIRDQQISSVVNVVLVKVMKPYDLFTKVFTVGSDPGQMVNDLLVTNKKLKGEDTVITIAKMYDVIMSEGIELSISALTMEDTKQNEDTETNQHNKPYLNLKDIAVFKGDQLKGYISEEYAVAYNFVIDEIKTIDLTYTCPENFDKSSTIEILSSDTKWDYSFHNNMPSYSIRINGNAKIANMECNIDLKKPSELDAVERSLENKIKTIVTETIQMLQNDYQSDVFGFGLDMRRNHFKDWKKLKNDWPTTFRSMDFKIDVDFRITSIGEIDSTNNGEMKN